MARMSGRIELICGPMFAGKTTELLARLAAGRAAGLRVVAVQPVGDTRSGRGWLRSHTGDSFAAQAIAVVPDLPGVTNGAEVVGVDEAHFFGADLADGCRALAAQGVRVIAAGVDFDHRGRLFPAIAALQQCADERTTLTARCARCGAEAVYTQRLAASDAPIVVGGAEAYEPRCPACFDPPSTDGC